MKKVVNIYTDGACSGNQEENNLGGWGAILEYGKHQKEMFGSEKNTTNNRMELMALLAALKAINKPAQDICVYSDSAYLVNCFREEWYKNWQKNGWRTTKKTDVENKDIWEELIAFLDHHDIKVYKVKGHVDLKNKSTNLDAHYKKFVKWNGSQFTYEDFEYVTEMNNRADALANKGIDAIRN